MDFLIFSDSHGRSDRMREVLERQIQQPDAIFFAGDGLRDLDDIESLQIPIYSVSGNCDWFAATGTQTELVISLAGHTLLLTHGHAFGVKGGIGSLAAHAARVGADIVLFGHTHQACCQTLPIGSEVGGVRLLQPLYLFNPGSIGSDGSFGTLTIRGNSILLAHGEL